ncbi:MAG: SIS domain-containing protein [Candidatus Nanopelagicaceae bacterium]|nr:SIS domain-containing protein [Candidatus Nanopelagicaceae bacterium]
MSKPGAVMLSEITEIPRMLDEISSAMATNQSAKDLFKSHDFTNVVILARGTSDNAAHYLKYLLETQMGIPVGLASPSAATMYPTKFHYEKTLLIAISQSGQSTDLLSFAQAAKDGGAYLLSITNAPESPLAKLSNLHLPIYAGPELAVPATKSYVGQLMASYLLVMMWSNQKVDIDSIIKAARENSDDSDKYVEFAKNIEIDKPIYVLGRGFSYPNAKEFALKLQETSLIPVQGMSSSDFLHGPIASLNTAAQVVFIASQHLPENSFGEAPGRVRAITGRVFWIGNPRQAMDKDLVLKTAPSSSELTSSICDAITFQKVTHYLATSNGLDPDSPEGLSKVTITQ